MTCSEGRIERRLLCELIDDDVQSRGRMLAETVVQIDVVMSQKREATKVFNQKLEGLGEEQRKLTTAIRDRAEYRIVGCVVRFHDPCEGVKRIVRLDTGESIEEITMTDGEKQLHLFASQGELAQLFASQGELAQLFAEQGEAAPVEAAEEELPKAAEQAAPDAVEEAPDEHAPDCAECGHSLAWHDEEFGACGMLDCKCRAYVAKQDRQR